MLSFYVSTVAGAMAKVDKPTEQFVATIFPFLSRSFKSKVSEYKLASYMIASQLALKVKLKGDITDELIYKMIKGADSNLLNSLLSSIAVIFSVQNTSSLKAKTWSSLLKTENLANGLAEMQANGVSCDKLISTIVTAVFRRVFASRNIIAQKMDTDDQGIAGEEEEDPSWLLPLLDELFVSSEISFSASLTAILTSNLLSMFCVAYEADHHAKKALDLLKDPITVLAKRLVLY